MHLNLPVLDISGSLLSLLCSISLIYFLVCFNGPRNFLYQWLEELRCTVCVCVCVFAINCLLHVAS